MVKLAFDIGAFRGEYTDRYLVDGYTVIAVEPQAVQARILREKFEGKPVTVVEAAVGADNGKAMLHKTGASWLASLHPERWEGSRFHGYVWHEVGDVQVITLDSLIERFGMPDFVKIDTEGGEREVFMGLSKPAPFLSFEFSIELLEEAKFCGNRLLEIGDYEFAISYQFEDRPREYTTFDRVLATLRADKTPLQWGNIYARLKHG